MTQANVTSAQASCTGSTAGLQWPTPWKWAERCGAQLKRWVSIGVVAAFAIIPISVCHGQNSDNLNRIIEGTPTATGPGGVDGTETPATPGERDPQDERWIKFVKPIENLQLIVGRREADDTCQDVIFKIAEAVAERLDIKGKTDVPIPLDTVCWIQLRNASQDRALVFRFSESFKQIAVQTNPQVLYGRQLVPYEIVTFALRPISDPVVSVKLEVIWDDAREPTVQPGSITLKFLAKQQTLAAD